MFREDEKADFQNNLLAWFQQNKRDFPWRKETDPFAILVAEKLLQQTAARDAVVLAYNQILTKYSSPSQLAQADLTELEEIFQPLGREYPK